MCVCVSCECVCVSGVNVTAWCECVYVCVWYECVCVSGVNVCVSGVFCSGWGIAEFLPVLEA